MTSPACGRLDHHAGPLSQKTHLCVSEAPESRLRAVLGVPI